MPPITLRVRTQIGTWRVENVSKQDTMRAIRERLQKEHDAEFLTNAFFRDPSKKECINENLTVNDAKLNNGDMLFIDVDERKTGIHEASTLKKKITKDGQIISQDVHTELQNNGFRPGMLPLRSMKMQWTLNEFVSLDEQFIYKIKAQEKSKCTLASIDSSCMRGFQNYVRKFDFRSIRVGFLFGKFNEDKSVKVEAIYEPPQEGTETSFQVFVDSKEEHVNEVARLLGLKKVGWIFAHPPREKGFYFSGTEILFAAEQQLEAAGGIEDTPFVTVKVTLDDKAMAVVEAFQVSKQCMEMVAEGVLQPSSNLGLCAVNPTFTAVVEGKNSNTVDNNFFIVTTPIQQFESQFLLTEFPPSNRIDVIPTRDDVKRQFSKAGQKGWKLIDLVSDFHLLIFLSDFLSVRDDLPMICQSVVDRDVPLNEGYQILLRSIAGME